MSTSRKTIEVSQPKKRNSRFINKITTRRGKRYRENKVEKLKASIDVNARHNFVEPASKRAPLHSSQHEDIITVEARHDLVELNFTSTLSCLTHHEDKVITEQILSQSLKMESSSDEFTEESTRNQVNKKSPMNKHDSKSSNFYYKDDEKNLGSLEDFSASTLISPGEVYHRISPTVDSPVILHQGNPSCPNTTKKYSIFMSTPMPSLSSVDVTTLQSTATFTTPDVNYNYTSSPSPRESSSDPVMSSIFSTPLAVGLVPRGEMENLQSLHSLDDITSPCEEVSGPFPIFESLTSAHDSKSHLQVPIENIRNFPDCKNEEFESDSILQRLDRNSHMRGRGKVVRGVKKTQPPEVHTGKQRTYANARERDRTHRLVEGV